MDSNDSRHDYAGDAIRWLATGFGLGMLIGGALGVLLAPKAGRETREQLKEIATDLGERARVVAGEFGEKASSTYTTVSDRTRVATREAGDRVRTVTGDVKTRIATAKEAGGRAVKAVREGYRKTVKDLSGESDDSGEDKGTETGQ